MKNHRRRIEFTMRHPDCRVLRIIYVTEKKVTDRIVSPQSWNDTNSFYALCFGDGKTKLFLADQIYDCEMIDSNIVEIPHPITKIEVKK